MLFAVKSAIDWQVSRAYGHAYSVLFYVSPMDSPLFRASEALGYWRSLWCVATPFIFAGCLLTLGRLRDAGLSSRWVVLFFVPFANLLFFAAMAAAPPREPSVAPPMPAQSAYREGPSIDTRLAASERSAATCVLLAGSLGAVIGLGALGVGFGLFREYGTALMIGAPVIAGFATGGFYVRLRPTGRFSGAALATFVALTLTLGSISFFAIEGFACLIMALPLLLPVTLFGTYMGYAIAKETGNGVARTSATAPLLLLPALFGAERLSPLPPPEPGVVESRVVVDAPPEVVWRRVIAFPPLPPEGDGMLRTFGIATPLRATIDGEGVGAVRRCEFTTGTFVEPIDVWVPGRTLGFSVVSQPDPMVETTLWKGPRPPHLDGYLKTTRGEFFLEPMAGGKTRLIGRTWYTTGLAPEAYFRLWADAIIHRIHLRVLSHVARLAEADTSKGHG
jgi:hypothetical protein